MHWILIIAALVPLVCVHGAFKQSTGVPMPSSKTLRGVRRRARKAGKPEWQAVDEHIKRQQAKAARRTNSQES
jgi:hypothetical protein